jgi:hypothetical protein
MMIPALLAAILVGNAPVAVACSGAEPAIVGAALQSRTTNGNLNHYVVAVHVKNLGSKGQPSNTLQSVEVLQNGDHVDQKGLPPLRPGQTATVFYAFDRSAGAAGHTTRLSFGLSAHAGSTACSSADGQRFRLSV